MVVVSLSLLAHYSSPGGVTVVSQQLVYTEERYVQKDNYSSKLFNDYLDQTIAPVARTDVFKSKILPEILHHNEKEYKTKTFATNCSEKKIDVSFLKVHKAGSTTVMNIFLRFAIENNLNIVLPNKAEGYGFNYLGYGNTVSSDRIVPLPENETYNILCNHVVYNKDAFRSILPPDTVYVGILREPASHFVSAADYYGFHRQLLKIFHGDGTAVSQFLQNPNYYRLTNSFVNNRMSFDFGIPKKEFYNDDFVDNYIAELNQDYGLVMIMERFPESLVLLKRLLCWDTKDILYVPLNARAAGPAFVLTEEDKIRLKEYNKADFKLYHHFRTKFDNLVEKLGIDFQNEVQNFIEIQRTVKQFCIELQHAGVSDGAKISFPASQWGEAFYVSNADCRLMTESELPMMHRLIQNAWKKYNDSFLTKS